MQARLHLVNIILMMSNLLKSATWIKKIKHGALELVRILTTPNGERLVDEKTIFAPKSVDSQAVCDSPLSPIFLRGSSSCSNNCFVGLVRGTKYHTPGCGSKI